jgi:hypothetical protein
VLPVVDCGALARPVGTTGGGVAPAAGADVAGVGVGALPVLAVFGAHDRVVAAVMAATSRRA